MTDDTTRLLKEEDTRLLKEAPAPTEPTKEVIDSPEAPKMNPRKGRVKTGKAGAAVGGFVAGAAASAMATTSQGESAGIETDEDKVNQPVGEVENNVSENIETPAPEQVLLANDEGIRYAHVDADSFESAFAQARAQVGAGGVFEYNGRIYGTFYADEWDAMSPQDRTDYQSRVNEVAPSHNVSLSLSEPSYHVAESSVQSQPAVTNENILAVEPADNEIHVVGVESAQTDDGRIINMALVDNGGDAALLVDVDNDGIIDILLHDDNSNGNIEDNEVYDVSEARLPVSELEAMEQAQSQSPDAMYASDYSDCGMQDYVNDANMTMDV